MRGLPADRALLTARRLDVLRLAANGYTNAEIARELWISEDSVKSHMRLAYEQLGARDRAHAVAVCLVRGLIHPHEVQLQPPKAPKEAA
ncbi:helix-turn-helix transcriptional regulator [Streptomyces sp. NBC_00101]|uniref:response regulator transcription factor n=1 Tax=Streptomyces sp. NBC_00101 TaxID=2975651 RepID=UPI003252B73A